MRALVAISALAGCYSPAGDLPCTVSCEHTACPGSLVCESIDHLCHAPGASACSLVDAATEAPDTPFDGPANCYGAILFPNAPVCIDVLPGTLTITNPSALNTTAGIDCAPQITNYCVVAYEQIEVAAPVRATGTRPLVLIASGNLHVAASGDLDASSRRVIASPSAAGVDTAPGCATNNAGGMAIDGGAGGGAGGSFGGQGGNGGVGNGAMANGGLGAPAVSSTSSIRAGCPGGAGGPGTSPGGPGGAGGGAIALFAHGDVIIDGRVVVFGAGGSSQTPAGAGDRVAAAGGGSGGMIAIEGTTVHLSASSVVLASGAGGAGAGGTVTGTPGAGTPGEEPSSAAAAPGGMPYGAGGAGGNGSSKTQLGGQPGLGGTGVGGGGGGGGGGAGWIRIRTPQPGQLTIDGTATIAPARSP